MRWRVCALIEASSSPGRNPLMPELRMHLERLGAELVVWDPTEGFGLPPRAPDADLYLLKGDHPAVLTAAGCLADRGAVCLNSYAATAGAADKARTFARLAGAGIPVPKTSFVSDRESLARAFAGEACFVKPVRGAHGVGVTKLGPGDELHTCEGPWLVQEAIAGPGFDIKVYGVGDQVALRRVSFRPGVVDAPREPVQQRDPSIVQAALEAAYATDLVCFGADFMLGPACPVLIDLNAFPGYRDVPEAAGWVADAARAAIGGRQ